MAKRVIDDSTLTAIAEPVRSIMGLSDLLSPAAMASNLVSADGEVTNQETLIAELQELLEGKAGISDELTFVTGSFTPSADVATVDVEHNLGKIPKLVLLRTQTGWSSVEAYYLISGAYAFGKGLAVYMSKSGGLTRLLSSLPSSPDITAAPMDNYSSSFCGAGNATVQKITFGSENTSTTAVKLKSGNVYGYIIGG